MKLYVYPKRVAIYSFTPVAMDEEKLIYLVSTHTDLDDVSSPHYSNQERKHYIWKDIAKAMGQPVNKSDCYSEHVKL